MDYLFCFPAVIKLKSTTSSAIRSVLKVIFSRSGFPKVLHTDNGPQHVSLEFIEFAKSYCFQHTPRSPRYLQNNRQAVRRIHTVKLLIKQCTDPYLVLWNYRAILLPWCMLNSAELSRPWFHKVIMYSSLNGFIWVASVNRTKSRKIGKKDIRLTTQSAAFS